MGNVWAKTQLIRSEFRKIGLQNNVAMPILYTHWHDDIIKVNFYVLHGRWSFTESDD